MRSVDMAAQYRNGNTSRHKNKTGAPTGRPLLTVVEDLLGGCGSHVNAGELERLAVYHALNGHVMAGVRCHLVLSIHDVDFLVGIVHEHVLGAMFLDALGRALAGLVVRALDSALAV